MGTPLHRQAFNMRKDLLDQGYLDEQFVQLEDLQDDANPNFVEEVVTLFCKDSVRTMQSIEKALEQCPIDFAKLDICIQTFHGSSTSIGAPKLRNEITRMRNNCRQRNVDGCHKTYQLVRAEHETLRTRLQIYFQALRQAGPVETASRPK